MITFQRRICQNCGKEFVIEEEDFNFYKKIKVPPPTWCPECRSQRRLSFRNERFFYKRKCELCGKEIISTFSKDKPYKIFCSDCWHSDKWDPILFGKPYDFSRSFFEQFSELLSFVPRRNLIGTKNLNSEYTNYAAENKNCYLLFFAL